MVSAKDDFHVQYDPDWLVVARCEGTLFDHGPEQHKVNETLLTFLRISQQEKYTTILYSDMPGEYEERLQALCRHRFGDAAALGSIRHSSELDGKTAYMVIDKDHEAHGIKARFQIDPEDSRKVMTKISYLIMDGMDEIARAADSLKKGPKPPEQG